MSTGASNLPCRNNASSALNVIIETEVLVTELLQDVKGLSGLEVLKLDEAIWEAVVCCLTELLNHCHVLLPC